MAQCWLDGQSCDSQVISNRGLLYGDGVFRTLLVSQGIVHQQQRQLNKINHDAQAIGLQMPANKQIVASLDRAIQTLPNGTLRLCITAGDSVRGYARSGQPCHWIIQAAAVPDEYAASAKRGIDLLGVSWQLASQPALAGLKHLNRLDQVMARRQLPAGYAEGLVRNQAGSWVSGIMSNLFWYRDGLWHTPTLQDCGVAGMVRDWIIDHCAARGEPVELAESCRSDDLHQAQCVFVCNAVKGLVPVRSWTDRQACETHWPIAKIQSFAPLNQLQRNFQHPFIHA